MLTRLNTIDWQILNAPQITEWIMGLTSSSGSERNQAGIKLLEYFGQHAKVLSLLQEYKEVLSTDAPVFVTPFLVELLISSDAPDKAKILTILSILGDYKHTAGLENIQQIRAEKIYQYLLDNFDLYPQFLESDDSNTRIRAMYLLRKFDENVKLIMEKLLNKIEKGETRREEEKIVAIEIILEKIRGNISLAQEFSERFTRVLRQWVEDYFESISVKAYSAYCLIRLQGNNIEQSIVKMLSNVLKLPSYHTLNIPFFRECVDAFMQLGMQRGTDALLDIFDDQTNRLIIFDIASILLGIYFGAEDYNKVYVQEDYLDNKYIGVIVETAISPIKKPLNKLQKNILGHFVAKEELWEIETNLSDVFSLPKSKTGMQLLITEN